MRLFLWHEKGTIEIMPSNLKLMRNIKNNDMIPPLYCNIHKGINLCWKSFYSYDPVYYKHKGISNKFTTESH